MAEKRVIELEVKTDKANKAINDLNKSTTDLAASFEDVYGEMQPLSGRMGELEDRLYELALAGKQNTQEYKDLQSEVAKFKRVIMETDMAVDGASGTMSQKLSGALGGITSAFELGQGVMASFGVESAEIEEALLKVQSAMAISQGFAGLKEASNSFKALGNDLSSVLSKSAIGQKALAVATNIGAAAMKAFNVVLKANPIGLVIAAITALVGAIAFFTRETGKAKEFAEKYTKALENQRRAIDENFSALQKRQAERIALMKAQGATEQQIFEQELKHTLDLAKAKAKAHLQEKYSYQNLRRTYKQLMDQGDEEEAASVREQLKASRERYLELQKQSKEYYHQISHDNKIHNAENIQKNKENAEKVRQNALEIHKQQAEDRKAANEKRKQEEEQRLKEAMERAEKEKEFILTEDIEEALRQQLVDSEAAKDEIRQEAIAKQEEDELALMQFKGDLYKQDIDNFEQAEKAKEELRRRNQQFALDTTKQGLELISNISEVFAKKGEKQAKKAFQIQKAASIASATIATYQSAVSAYQSQFLPLPDPSSPIRGAIAAGLAVAAGLTNIAKISKQKFEGGGASGSSGSSGASAAGAAGGGAGATSAVAPSFNIVGNAQATNPLAGLGGQPLQAYVVSGEVTTAQSLDRNRVNYATFG